MTSTEKEVYKQLRTVHRRVALWYYLAIGCGWIAIQAGFFVLLIPKITEQYRSMDVELPRFTTALIDASAWMAGDNPGQSMPGWMLAVPVAFIAVVASALVFRRSAILLTLIPILAVISLIGELFLLLSPLYQLTESLTQ